MACLELPTDGSLNESFLKEYKNTLDKADKAVVFYSPKALEIKHMKPLKPEQILMAFEHPNLKVCSDPLAFQTLLKNQSYTNTALLLMSSGTYGGLDFESLETMIL